MIQVAVGIDIGGTNTSFGLVTAQGDVLSQGKVKTKQFDTIETFVQAIAQEIKSLVHSYNNDITLTGIGIGAPNGSYYKGTIEHAPNLDWNGVLPVVEIFKSYFDVPIHLTNDANAAALGEMHFGNATDMENYIYVTLGTGLGSGFVNQGKLIYGHSSFAGELGHTIIEPNGRMCNCGRKGCLERYASATGLMITAKEMLADYSGDTSLRQYPLEELDSKIIAEAAERADPLALKIFDYTADKLALGLSNAAAITDPEAIFLFGGIAMSGDILLIPTKMYLDQYLLNMFKNTKLMLSGVSNENAAILGASSLVWNERHK